MPTQPQIERRRQQINASMEAAAKEVGAVFSAAMDDAVKEKHDKTIQDLIREMQVIGEQHLLQIARFKDVERRERVFLDKVMQVLAKRHGVRVRTIRKLDAIKRGDK